MTRLTFSVPDELAPAAFEHVRDFAYVLEPRAVPELAPGVEIRESSGTCERCGRRLREERRGPIGSWVRVCPMHGDDRFEEEG